tara:strand:- start:401 stop:835 length:435 start_codon:yes stop_codon:yes gene_type:complete
MSSDAVKKNSETKSKTSEDKTPSKTEASSDSTSPEKTKSNKNAASARPISYFSSVSTDEYRSGWNAIFNDSKNNKRILSRKNSKRKSSINSPQFVILNDSDLNEELTGLLLAAVKKRVKKDKLSFGRRINKSNLKWRLECEIGK